MAFGARNVDGQVVVQRASVPKCDQLHAVADAQNGEAAALRAVEQRRFLVRASTSGPSAIIDPYGRILARTNPMTSATVTAEIRPIEGRTVYSAVGDLFGFGCLALAALGAVTSRRLD